MTSKAKTGIVLSALVLGLAGCSDSGSSSIAPSTRRPAGAGWVHPAYTLSNVTLSGVVSEGTPTGQAPIAGVDVYCELCGAETHTWASTNSNGFYSFTGVWTDAGHFPTRISFSKDGYVDPAVLPPNTYGPGWREVVVNGDTRFDVQLVRR
jgi:hypothetical protein